MAYPGEPLFKQDLTWTGGTKSVVAPQSPTALRRFIRISLRQMREAADKTRAEAAVRLGKTEAAYRHYENGTRTPSATDIEVLLNWYGKPERVPFYRELLKAAQKGTDWWIGFPGEVPSWFELYLGLEAAAAWIRSYDALWIPGLFQTPEYSTALFKAVVPVPTKDSAWTNLKSRLTDEEIAERVKLRMARQAILTRPDDPPQVRCVLDETVLRRQVGRAIVMDAQITRLLELIELPNVKVQILPHELGAHAGGQGTFTILDYPNDFEGDPGTVYVETWQQGIYYDQEQQVKRQRLVFDRLLEQAEKPEKTKQLIIAAARNR